MISFSAVMRASRRPGKRCSQVRAQVISAVASLLTRSYIAFRSAGSSRWHTARSDQSSRNGNWTAPLTGPANSPSVSGSSYGRLSA